MFTDSRRIRRRYQRTSERGLRGFGHSEVIDDELHGIMAVAVPRTTLFRIVALFLLLFGGMKVYACASADDCVISQPGQSDDCDQPSGDNCWCCCHHVVPAAMAIFEAAEYVCDGTAPEPAARTLSVTLPIERPPQL